MADEESVAVIAEGVKIEKWERDLFTGENWNPVEGLINDCIITLSRGQEWGSGQAIAYRAQSWPNTLGIERLVEDENGFIANIRKIARGRIAKGGAP